jgi:uncharacterized protein YukE
MPGPQPSGTGIVGVGDSTPGDVANLATAITGTQAVLAKLTTDGNNLSNPAVWDGEYAQTFRSGWGEVSQSFTTLVTELNKLQGEVQQITAAIQRAGGSH